VLLGLRDKVAYLSARPELYGLLLVVFLFPIENLIVASQLVLVCIWLGAASSKLNRHFPFVVAVMISNTPWNRSHAVKRRLYRNYPEDLRSSQQASFAAHLGTAMEFSLPLLLLGTIAVVGMVIFHVHITSTFPLAVPLEWVVMIESQPAHVQRQHYRIHDAASGLIEEGYVRVADMVERQPWLYETGTFPVEVIPSNAPRPVGAPVPK
jgi:Transmembrane protein of unknown function (DUF3556)